ncbi:MAG: DUF4411 family protein [Pelolinea sp.]|jgi:hypothetical protein|nr:DUF4411 family protein [Pelolinea sp.]
MLYLLDANVLIDANRDYYPLDRVPEFWEWLIFQGTNGNIKIPIEIHEEIKAGRDDDPLTRWIRSQRTVGSMLLNEEVNLSLIRKVIKDGYAENLTDNEVEELGRDPFLIAYALSDNNGRSIVTTEISRPNRQRTKRHIPDVCMKLNINCVNTFELTRTLQFSTHWNNNP